MITLLTLLALIALFPSTFMSVQTIIINHCLMMTAMHLKMDRIYRALVRIDQVMTFCALRLFHFYYGMKPGLLQSIRQYVDNKGSQIYTVFRNSPLYTTPNDK